jgi:hypothetical protein
MLFIQASAVEEEVAAALEAPLGAATPAEAAGPVVEAAARTEDGHFVCPICGLAFNTKHSLQQHLLRKHAATEPIICSYGQPFRMSTMHILRDPSTVNEWYVMLCTPSYLEKYCSTVY